MYGDRRVGLDVSHQGQHAHLAFAIEGTFWMIAEDLFKKGKAIQPIADAASVVKILLHWTATARLGFVPQPHGLPCALLLFRLRVPFGFVATTLHFPLIDNVRTPLRIRKALCLTVIAEEHRELGLDQVDRENFALALLRRASSF